MSRQKIHRKIRHVIHGTAARPRLSVYKGLTNIYAQIINDERGVTLASANSLSSKGPLTQKATVVGEQVAHSAIKQKIKTVVFDRGGSRYHGAVKALADAARKKGLKF